MAIRTEKARLCLELDIPVDATHFTVYNDEFIWWKKESQQNGRTELLVAPPGNLKSGYNWTVYRGVYPATHLRAIERRFD